MEHNDDWMECDGRWAVERLILKNFSYESEPDRNNYDRFKDYLKTENFLNDFHEIIQDSLNEGGSAAFLADMARFFLIQRMEFEVVLKTLDRKFTVVLNQLKQYIEMGDDKTSSENIDDYFKRIGVSAHKGYDDTETEDKKTRPHLRVVK